jgi:kumamolisin
MATTGKSIPIRGSYRPAVPGATLIKKSDQKQTITVTVYVRRNPDGQASAPDVMTMNQELPAQRKYLSAEEFTKHFGADPNELKKIVDWAQSNGLTVVSQNIDARRVVVQGPIAKVNQAFGVELNEYEEPRFGKFRGRVGNINVDESVFGLIDGVFGLDNRKVGHSRRRRSPARAVPIDSLNTHTGPTIAHEAHTTPSIGNAFPGAFLPTDVAKLYEYPANTDGKTQNIAIFAFNGTDPDPRGGYSKTALDTYFKQVISVPTPNIKDVVVLGPGNKPGPDTEASNNQGDTTGEVMLDMCTVGAAAPGANIFMYFTEFTSQGWVNALQDAITDGNNISVVSISYGNPEDDPRGAWTSMGVKMVNQVFEAAAAKGITICCASGDDGSADEPSSTRARVDFPASSPYVLGVGGTKLAATGGTAPKVKSETVWNEELKDEGAGGGGVSSVFTKPSYQNAVNVPQAPNPPHHVGRGVPDVAAVADPETGVVVMHIDGKHLESIGGTSAAAPLWAALIARVNQALGAKVGFLNPLLYSRLLTGVLRDITHGNNGAFKAGTGWDPCTGVGCPGGSKMVETLSATHKASKTA